MKYNQPHRKLLNFLRSLHSRIDMRILHPFFEPALGQFSASLHAGTAGKRECNDLRKPEDKKNSM